ncbi:MAG TPA: DUF1573 domain-containing protein [Pirellulales bacterium]|jgi:hypothetical protein|nr:DUF1573 domain-containing protein [Pirellulales bacterium]
MRALGFILSPLVLGVLAGIVMARYEVGVPRVPLLPPPDQPTLAKKNPAAAVAAPVAVPNGTPKLVVAETAFDFGTLPPQKPSQHAFLFQNQGTGELQLSKGKSSCFCTVAEIEKPLLAPGESTRVTLEFTGQHIGPFSQHVTVGSNDPHEPVVVLNISGLIRPLVVSDPEQFALGTISAKEPKAVELRLYAFGDLPLRVEKHEFTDPKWAADFDISDRSLTPAEAKSAEAKSGVLLTITLKSGLPSGRIQTRILLTTNIPDQPVVEVPFEARLVGDVSLLGRGWNADDQSVTLGAINQAAGAQRELSLVVRGERGAKTEFKIASVQPGLLQVKLGTPRAVGENNHLWQTPLTIKIPPGSPIVNHLGGAQGAPGEIVLESNHPDAPRLRLQVKFAIEE